MTHQPERHSPFHTRHSRLNLALRTAIPFSLLALSPSWTAAADTASQTETTLKQVVVNAAAQDETATAPTTGYVAKRAASATKTDTAIADTPQSISVVTTDQIRDQGAQSVQDALRYVAGVRSEPYGLDSRGDWSM